MVYTHAHAHTHTHTNTHTHTHTNQRVKRTLLQWGGIKQYTQKAENMPTDRCGKFGDRNVVQMEAEKKLYTRGGGWR